jgi:hypothetical protein
MKDLDLAGHPGLQNHEGGKGTEYEHEKEPPLTGETEQKTPKPQKTIKKGKGTPAGFGFLRIAIILVIIIGAFSLGYYIYTNQIQTSKPVVRKQDRENIREGSEGYPSKQQGGEYIQTDNFKQNLGKGELYLSTLTKILSNLPSKIFISSLQCSNYYMEGKIYYIEKSKATQFERELIVNFPAIAIKNYELNKIEDVLPFRWSVYMYLDFHEIKAKNIEDSYRAFSDKQLSNMINSIATQRDIDLKGFRISSKEINTVRKFRITGQGRIMNLCTFFNSLTAKNTNLYFRDIKIYTDKSKGKTTFQIDGKIYPGK